MIEGGTSRKSPRTFETWQPGAPGLRPLFGR